MQAGYRAVIAPGKGEGFADIFETNAFNNGLLVIELDPDDWKSIAASGREHPGKTEATIDLQDQMVTLHGAEGCGFASGADLLLRGPRVVSTANARRPRCHRRDAPARFRDPSARTRCAGLGHPSTGRRLIRLIERSGPARGSWGWFGRSVGEGADRVRQVRWEIVGGDRMAVQSEGSVGKTDDDSAINRGGRARRSRPRSIDGPPAGVPPIPTCRCPRLGPSPCSYRRH